MRRILMIGLGMAAAALSSASLAFEEQKLKPQAPAAQGSPATPNSAGRGAALVDPGIAVPRVDSGTKIRVPGLGVIGEIPKMDFGLELLYGASQSKSSEMERGEGNGVMGRVTVPIKPR